MGHTLRAFVLLAAAMAAVTAATLEPLVTLGLPTQSSVRIRVQSFVQGAWAEASLFQPGVGYVNPRSCFMGPVDTTDGACVIEFDGLEPDTEYTFTVSIRDWSQGGRVRTLSPTTAKFAFGSCAHQLGETHGVFEAIAARAPQLFLSLGDFIYADLSDDAMPARDLAHPTFSQSPPSASHFVAKYRHALGAPRVAAFGRSTPLVGVWDDHELADNFDSSQSRELLATARRAFDSFFGMLREPAPSPGATPGPLFFNISLGPVDLFVLDTRSYRDSYVAEQSPSKTLLGAAQRAHVLRWLAESRAPFRVLASSVIWNDCGASAPDWKGEPLLDSWWRYRHERDVLLEAAAAAPGGPTLLLSADSHWPSATTISGRFSDGRPWSLREVSVSPLDAFALPTATERSCAVGAVHSHIDFAEGPPAWPRDSTDLVVSSFFGLVEATESFLSVSIRRVVRGAGTVVFEERIDRPSAPALAQPREL